MQTCILILLGILACMNVYQQKQIRKLKEQTTRSIGLIWKSLGVDEEM